MRANTLFGFNFRGESITKCSLHFGLVQTLIFENRAKVSSVVQDADDCENVVTHDIINANLIESFYSPYAQAGERRICKTPRRTSEGSGGDLVDCLIYSEKKAISEISGLDFKKMQILPNNVVLRRPLNERLHAFFF
ncbi:hypothetical protein V3H18_09855 [Methylocystis sp. 9N]|uniref:Uncharacterized protein n=1 Tax=Methylocystis borbori TaxID=3118750 RepID=A0ABU7XI98_9HYPH